MHIGMPDEGDRLLGPGDWAVVSASEWTLRMKASPRLHGVCIHCSRKVWKLLTSPLQAAVHAAIACFTCDKRSESLFVRGRAGNEISRFVEEVLACDFRLPIDRISSEAAALGILSRAVKDEALSSGPGAEPCLREADQQAIERAACILRETLANDHSLDSLSRAARLNEFKLKRGFRERFGTSVFGYLRERRMERARELLHKGQLSVLHIANEVGYSNPSHFTRAFRKCYGLNPKAYRQQARS